MALRDAHDRLPRCAGNRRAAGSGLEDRLRRSASWLSPMTENTTAGVALPASRDLRSVSGDQDGRPANRDRLRVSLAFSGFEMVMPLIGFGIGHILGNRIGHIADYLAIGLLVAVRIHMLLPENADPGRSSKRAMTFFVKRPIRGGRGARD
jgi:Putative manganese efflux pump